MSFSDEIKAAIAKARSGVDPTQSPFLRLLQEMASGVSSASDKVKCYVVDRKQHRYGLHLAPAYQPGRSNLVLMVRLIQGGIEVLGGSDQRFHSEFDFQKYLRDLAVDPVFLDSVAAVEDAADQPVEGFLRERLGHVSREDVMLEVSPDDQKTIATSGGQKITLQLPVANFPGAGVIKEGHAYGWLESAGLVLKVEEWHKEDDERVRVTGALVPDQERPVN